MHLHIYSHMDEVQNLMSGLLQCFHAITRAAATSSIRGAVQELQFCLGTRCPVALCAMMSTTVINSPSTPYDVPQCSSYFIMFAHGASSLSILNISRLRCGWLPFGSAGAFQVTVPLHPTFPKFWRAHSFLLLDRGRCQVRATTAMGVAEKWLYPIHPNTIVQ